MEFVGRVASRRGVIEVEERGVRRKIDLASEPLDMPDGLGKRPVR